ncbi:long-chain fatty acid--CoA ligase [Rhodobacteraceae bacterium CH30]|nr:long-chain fatty acid--CoA ligase [Rhodobacteraceae bacterium CH30]
MTQASSYNLADLFEQVAHAVPDRSAVISGEATLSYRELEARADALAALLARRGIRRGDTVGLLLYNGAEYLATFFAACKLGALPVNINYRYVGAELAYVFDNARLSALVYAPALASTVEALLPDFPAIQVALCCDAALEAELAAPHEPAPRDGRNDDDLMLLYTGGTTGAPKGVMWTHKALFFGALGGGDMYRKSGQPVTSPQELAAIAQAGTPLRFMPVAPMMHGAAMWATLVSLFAGHTVVTTTQTGFDAMHVLDTMAQQRVNITAIVGDAMAMPIRDALEANPGRWDLSAVYVFGSGGAPFARHLQDDIKRHMPNAHMGNGYGTSEGGVIGQGPRPDGEGLMTLQLGPELAVLTPTGSAHVVPGETGILARAGHVPCGYWGDERKTAETFIRLDGVRYALLGDAARLEADGSTITLLGRGSQCINTGGEKVFPEEVEDVLRRHPDVTDVLVVGIPDPRWGQKVTAVVSLRRAASAGDEALLREHCRDLLAGYKLPKHVVVVPEVARSVAGKADYRWARQTAESTLKNGENS